MFQLYSFLSAVIFAASFFSSIVFIQGPFVYLMILLPRYKTDWKFARYG